VPYDAVPGWVAVVPVKRLAVAKTRLGEATDERRVALARAFAWDTVAALDAAAAIAAVVVVTSDEQQGAALGRFEKVEVLSEDGNGMNAAVRQGAGWARQHWGAQGVAVFVADLPAATADSVETFLDRAAHHQRGVLADQELVGTTALTARPEAPLSPAFGPQSLRLHRASGATLVDLSGLDRLRRDVDVMEHLRTALRLGVGAATRRVVAAAFRD